ncbi:MAG: hypothetical protein P8H17_06915, partial [Flavobacteriales bacterium]|nr:hypothetical protein [Flavobacteriales bacterium]
MRNSILVFALILFFVSSCVSPKIHNALISDYDSNQKNLNQKEKETLRLSDELEELSSNIVLLKEKISQLKNDSVQNGNSLINLQNKYDELS